MNRSLSAFMAPPTIEEEEVVVSQRFKEEDGTFAKWVIRPISSAENDMLQKKHLKRNKKGEETFDRVSYVNEMIASAVVHPNLKNADLQKAWGVLGDTQLLGKMLLAGEFAYLSQKVQEISGISTIEDDIEEVKN